MLCVTIFGPDKKALQSQMCESAPYADLFEWRLDLYDQEALRELGALRRYHQKPLLLTLRSKAHGGCFIGEPKDGVAFLKRFSALKPEYLDVEDTTPLSKIQALRESFPQASMILSSHRQERKIAMPWQGHVKVAIQGESILDVLEMMRAIKDAQQPFTGIVTGELGEPLRVLSKILGSSMDFAAPNGALSSIYRQLRAQEMHTLYRYPHTSTKTKICALIGDPVYTSRGPIFHNAAFKKLGEDAIYTCFAVKAEELLPFLQALERFSLHGMSVTMPHKEAIMAHVVPSSAAKAIGSVNTLVRKEGCWHGHNTDGLGAIQALAKITKLHGKKVLVLGAGGTARAIAYELLQQGATVILCNRTRSKGEKVAQELGLLFCPFEDLGRCLLSDVQILVHATPVGMSGHDPSGCLVHEEMLPSSLIVLEVVSSPEETLLVQRARRRGCQLVLGKELFLYQALEQLKLWFPHHKEAIERL